LLVTPGAYPRRKHLKGPLIGFALALPSNSKTRQERVSKGKPSSLFGLFISDEGKKFYNIDTRGFSVQILLFGYMELESTKNMSASI
jgi:hypothetical protein